MYLKLLSVAVILFVMTSVTVEAVAYNGTYTLVREPRYLHGTQRCRPELCSSPRLNTNS